MDGRGPSEASGCVHALFQQRVDGDEALLRLAGLRFAQMGTAAEVYADTPDHLEHVLRFVPPHPRLPVVHLSRGVNVLHGRDRALVREFYGFHPLGAWLANTAESLAMLLRPGNAGSNTFADHAAVLTAAIRQIPSRMRSRLLVRVDGADASHELITHLLSLSSRCRTVLFTCGWMITPADERAIAMLPAAAWQAAVDQDGTVQEDKHVAEITHLISRAAGWPAGCGGSCAAPSHPAGR